MGRAEARDRAAGLGEGGRVSGMGMNDRADAWEGLEKPAMGRGVGRGTKYPLHHFPVEIEQDQVVGCELLVLDAAGLDGEDAAGPVDHADIAKGQVGQPQLGQSAVGGPAFLPQLSVAVHWEYLEAA